MLVKLFLTIYCLALTDQSAEVDKEYFRSIAYNLYPFWTINGVYPIEKENIGTAKYYYCFEYDTIGRLIKIGFYKNHKLFNGVSQHYGNPGTPVVKISYTDRKEIREYFDVFGNKVKGRWGSYGDVYGLDEKNRKVSLEFRDENGVPIAPFNGVSRYEWSWLSDTRVIEKRYDLNGSGIKSDPDWGFDIVEYNLNEKGQYLSISNLGPEGKGLTIGQNNVAQIRLSYNEEGQELGGSFFNHKNEPVIIGEGTGKVEIAQSQGSFDRKGRYIIEQYFNLDGNLTPFLPYPYSQRIMKYDRFDNRVLTYYLDNQDNVVDGLGKGYYFQKELIDSDGYTLSTQFLNLDSSLVNRTDTKVAEIKYQYDSLKRVIEISYFNENSVPTNNFVSGHSKIQYVYDKNHVTNIPIDTVRVVLN